jgi:hypothetical protein
MNDLVKLARGLAGWCGLAALLVMVAPEARAENVSRCFSVHEMVKTEPSRYLVRAVSECAQVYDAVYVMVSFLDSKGRHLGEGVWAIYWCRPGRYEVHEFGIPTAARGFDRVVMHGITTDFRDVLGRQPVARMN